MLNYINVPQDKKSPWIFGAEIWDEETLTQLLRDYKVIFSGSGSESQTPILIHGSNVVFGSYLGGKIYFFRNKYAFLKEYTSTEINDFIHNLTKACKLIDKEAEKNN